MLFVPERGTPGVVQVATEPIVSGPSSHSFGPGGSVGPSGPLGQSGVWLLRENRRRKFLFNVIV